MLDRARKRLSSLFEFKVRPRLNEPIYYSPRAKNWVSRLILGFLPISTLIFSVSWMRRRLWTLEVNVRIVEVPFVYNNLHVEKGIILDVGCAESKVAIETASIGCKVIGVDIRDYNLTHPNFQFLKGNICDAPLRDQIFDRVIAISTVEHIGLGGYGGTMIQSGDKIALDEIFRILKKGGKLLLTVPYGKKSESTWERVYDERTLRDLLQDFAIEKEEYALRTNRRYWIPVSKDALKDVASKEGVDGVVMVSAVKH